MRKALMAACSLFYTSAFGSETLSFQPREYDINILQKPRTEERIMLDAARDFGLPVYEFKDSLDSLEAQLQYRNSSSVLDIAFEPEIDIDEVGVKARLTIADTLPIEAVFTSDDQYIGMSSRDSYGVERVIGYEPNDKKMYFLIDASEVKNLEGLANAFNPAAFFASFIKR